MQNNEKYYVFIQNGKINGFGMCPCTGENLYSIEVTEEIYNNVKDFGSEYYVFKNGEISLNPDYEAIQSENEKRARIDEIKTELENIDRQSQRSARAVALCYASEETPNPDDVKKLAELENQATELREELQGLAEDKKGNE